MSADLYQRPSREQIAARVNSALPGARKPDPPPDPLANFSTCLRARMRALGWDQAHLQGALDIGPYHAARAINGNGVDLGLAGRIAALVGRDLAAMISPYQCGTCHGAPPAGYACLECGAKVNATARDRLEAATAERAGRPA